MKYHPYGNIDPFKNLEVADKVLNEYWDIADALKIETFLWHGTCLGFVRDGGYIIADNDIDVGILGNIEELTVGLVKAGFEKKRTCKRSVHFLKYGILLDVYWRFRHHKYFQSFSKVRYKGRVYNIPHPVEKYFEARYGDWKTKKYRKVWEG